MESKKLIGPREEPLSSLKDIAGTHECGICFNAFKTVLNQLSCCKYEICTECFLQLKTPPESLAKTDFVQPDKPSVCPYCRNAEFEVIYPPGNAVSTDITMKHKAIKGHPKATPAPRAKARAHSAGFIQCTDADSLEAIEQMMLMAALANSSRDLQENNSAAAAAAPASAHASAATTTSADAAISTTPILRQPAMPQPAISGLAPQSPPMLPLSRRATTPELNVETPKRSNSNGPADMLPLSI